MEEAGAFFGMLSGSSSLEIMFAWQVAPRQEKVNQSHSSQISGIVYDAENYGLSLIVGGTEASLYEKGDRQQVIFEIAHRNPQKTVFWSLNDRFFADWILNAHPFDKLRKHA